MTPKLVSGISRDGCSPDPTLLPCLRARDFCALRILCHPGELTMSRPVRRRDSRPDSTFVQSTGPPPCACHAHTEGMFVRDA